MSIFEVWQQMKLEKGMVPDQKLMKQIANKVKDKQMLRPYIKGQKPNKTALEENWKQSDEGRWMAKHCPRQYYETIQSIRGTI